MRRLGVRSAAIVVALIVTGCAVRIGGARSADFAAMALRAETMTVAEAAAQIRAAAADLVLLSAATDSAWFAAVAAETGLTLSGPGTTGERALGFLTTPALEILGDTSIALPVPSGGNVHMHDALYRIDRNRLLDLMHVRFEGTTDLRAATRTLLEYVATDVGATVPLLLAVEAPTPAAADSVAILMRALYPTTWDCTDAGRAGEPAPALGVRLFHGPTVRVACTAARQLAGADSPIVARLVIGR